MGERVLKLLELPVVEQTPVDDPEIGRGRQVSETAYMLPGLTPDEVISESVDPDGQRVVLLVRVLQDKILIDHPELEPFVTEILRAVAAPDHRERDPTYEDRLRYYARDIGPSRWLLVVVSYEQAPARIVSAFGVRKDPRAWNA